MDHQNSPANTNTDTSYGNMYRRCSSGMHNPATSAGFRRVHLPNWNSPRTLELWIFFSGGSGMPARMTWVKSRMAPARRLFSSGHGSMFTHANGMVDVSAKDSTVRIARASCAVSMPSRVFAHLFESSNTINSKGNIIETSRIAGVMAAKNTSSLIPLCHPVPLSQIRVNISPGSDSSVLISSEAKTVAQTGVEMEALTAVSVAALTLYDMTKSALKGTSDEIVISNIRLDFKSGGSHDIHHR